MTGFTDTLTRQWQDVASLVLGLWLILSPWVLGYVAVSAAFYNAVILGVIIAVAAVAALVRFQEWEAWVSLLLGVWLIVSPWILGITMATAMWNAIIVGVLVAAMAAWSIYSARQGQRQPA